MTESYIWRCGYTAEAESDIVCSNGMAFVYQKHNIEKVFEYTV